MDTESSSNGRVVTTREASVKTAAISIKAMTINNKQVTLSVFRQLKEEPLIDLDKMELRGEVWGHVNYFWGDCKPNHLHVVWQLLMGAVYR
jgi:hypothetical protein